MSHFHAVARRRFAVVAEVGRWIAGEGAGAARNLAQPTPAPVEGGPCFLTLAQALPFLIDGAPDLSEELLGLRARARDRRARLVLGGADLRLRAREHRRALGLALADQLCALRIPTIAVVHAREELL